MINKTVAILAGGKSSRMNYNNKALLSYKEITFIEHIIKAASNYKEVVIVANDKSPYERFGVRIVEDIFKGNGPLSGIHSALKNSTTNHVLCIACDMPLTSKSLLDYMGTVSESYEVLIPKYKDRLQPLCSIYTKSIIDNLENSINKNENKLQKLIFSLDYKVIDRLEDREFNKMDFFNVNTPSDFKVLEDS